MKGGLRRRGARFLWFAAALLVTATAGAHPTPGSVSFVDFTVDGARIEQDVPVEELERALHLTLAEAGLSPESIVARHAQLLYLYAGAHLSARSVDSNVPWDVHVLDVVGHASDDGPRARFTFLLSAPDGEASSSVLLHDDVVAHEVVSHYTNVYVRSDWARGVEHARPELAGTIHAGRNEVTIVRGGSFWRGLRGIVTLGMEHIATGSDHLLFLFALLLVAPVSAQEKAWHGRRGIRDTLLTLARVVSAFTLGHSATLAVGALGWVTLPSVLIEAAIAVSILITAVHALRPLFPRREALVAGAFGLVHGLAFANTLAGRDLGRAQAVWTLLGFNTGIELAQLGLLFLVVPWVLLLADTRAYAGFRVIFAGLSVVLATGWLLERTTTFSPPTALPLRWLEAHPMPLLLTLAGGALLARALDRKPAQVRTGEPQYTAEPTSERFEQA